MLKPELEKTLGLLAKANSKGVRCFLDQNELRLQVRKNEKPDPALLKELKNNKYNITEYLRMLSEESGIKEDAPIPLPKTYDGDKVYYDITATQRYWVDEERDRQYKENDSIHGLVLDKREILGDLDPEIFKDTIAFILERHESLRSAFAFVEGKYRMRVLSGSPITAYYTYLDLFQDHSADKNALAEAFISYKSHRFDLKEGPLFQVRLIKMEEQRYIASFKIHHVLCDWLSLELVMRELVVVYYSLYKKTPPPLETLPFQYKEMLALENDFVARHHEAHKAYWESCYNTLPPDIELPGVMERPRNYNENVLRAESFLFPEALNHAVRSWSKELSTSLFVVLQATLYRYLSDRSGCTDILVGTYVFGRDYPGAENQIGCYAKTMLIRTRLSENDSIEETIRKVHRSNEEMRLYRACTLMEVMERLLPSSHPPGKSFWNILVQYDEAGASDLTVAKDGIPSGDLKIQLNQLGEETNSLFFVDLEFRFSHVNDGFRLKINYNGGRYSQATIKEIVSEYFMHMARM